MCCSCTVKVSTVNVSIQKRKNDVLLNKQDVQDFLFEFSVIVLWITHASMHVVALHAGPIYIGPGMEVLFSLLSSCKQVLYLPEHVCLLHFLFTDWKQHSRQRRVHFVLNLAILTFV